MPIWQRTYSWLWMWSRIWLWFSLRGSSSDFNTWWLSDLFVWFSLVQQMPKENFLHWVRSSQARSGRVGCPEKSLILSCVLVYSWQREAAQDFCAATAALGLWFCPWIASQLRPHCGIQAGPAQSVCEIPPEMDFHISLVWAKQGMPEQKNQCRHCVKSWRTRMHGRVYQIPQNPGMVWGEKER